MLPLRKGSPEEIEIFSLGRVDYASAYHMQQKLVQERAAEKRGDCIMFLEHPAVYTYGRSTEAPPVGIKSLEVERGGEVTYHNPGQLVCYPIIRLEKEQRDVRAYLRLLEENLIRTLDRFGITGMRVEGATGIWVSGGQKKIASIGVAVKGWVTYHGWALNVSNNLAGFSAIRPCGFAPTVMTSMKQLLGSRCPVMHKVEMVASQTFMELLYS